MSHQMSDKGFAPQELQADHLARFLIQKFSVPGVSSAWQPD